MPRFFPMYNKYFGNMNVGKICVHFPTHPPPVPHSAYVTQTIKCNIDSTLCSVPPPSFFLSSFQNMLQLFACFPYYQ